MFSGLLADAAEESELRTAAMATFNVLVSAIELGQSGGIVREGDASELALSAWSMTHGLTELSLEGVIGIKTTLSPEQIAQSVLQNVIVGLSP